MVIDTQNTYVGSGRHPVRLLHRCGRHAPVLDAYRRRRTHMAKRRSREYLTKMECAFQFADIVCMLTAAQRRRVDETTKCQPVDRKDASSDTVRHGKRLISFRFCVEQYLHACRNRDRAA